MIGLFGFFEQMKHVSNIDSGFCQGQSTVDHLEHSKKKKEDFVMKLWCQ